MKYWQRRLFLRISLHRRDVLNGKFTDYWYHSRMIDPVDDVTQPLPVATECPIRLQFSSPERIHTVILMQDLFKQWVILQAWSGKQSSSGGSKPRPFENLDAGLVALAAIARKHEQRGLVPVL